MVRFAVIEIADGLTVVEVQPGQPPEEAALSHVGVLVDPGLYATIEEASDALANLEGEEEEERLTCRP